MEKPFESDFMQLQSELAKMLFSEQELRNISTAKTMEEMLQATIKDI